MAGGCMPVTVRVRATKMAVPMAIRTAKSVTAAVKSVAGAESIIICPYAYNPINVTAGPLEGGGPRL